jgi:hypothetical protein
MKNKGLFKKKAFTDQEIQESLLAGNCVTKTMKLCNCGFIRAALILKDLKLKKVPIGKFGRKQNKNINIEEYIDRSNKKNWIKYMMDNPFYFEEVFGKVFSKQAVLDAAKEMF